MFKKATLLAAAISSALLFVAGCTSGLQTSSGSTVTPIALSASTLASGSVGTAYSAMIAATGGTPPYTYSLISGSLPGGLTLTKTGTLSGTPTGGGAFTFSVAAVDAISQRATANFSLAITTPVTITPASLPNGTVGTAYSATVAASGGATPYTFAVTSGTLPPGLNLNTATGAITGTPTVVTTSNFTITATDKLSTAGAKAYTVAIAAQPAITITPATLPSGTINVAYTSTTLSALNGTAPYTYSVPANSLPTGLTLTQAGILSGTPTVPGMFNFTVTATDSTARLGTQAYTLTIASGPAITISPATLTAASVGSSYGVTFTSSGGTAPYTYSAAMNSLPGGLTLASNGVLSGTPTATGTFSFTVTATDSKSQTGTANYSLTVGAAGTTITLGSSNLGALVNASYSAPLPLNGGTKPYTVTKTGGTLPGAISLSSGGTLSGTPTTTGSYSFTINVADSSSSQLTQTFTIALNVVDATVAIDTRMTVAQVPASFYGLHTAIYDNQLTDATTISTMMANAGVNVLRFPGGGLADVYHWAQHSVSPYAGSAPATCNDLTDAYISPIAHFGTFIKLLQASGAQAVITVNYGTSVSDANASRTTGYDGSGTANSYCSNPNKPGQPQEAAAWVAYANGSATDTHTIGVDAAGFDWKTTGYWASLRAASPLGTDDGYNFLRLGLTNPVGIKFWEVGNEMYYNGWSGPNPETDTHAPYVYPNGYNQAYSDRTGVAALSPVSYGANAAPFITTMKAVDPTILIGLDYDLPGATDPVNTSYNEQLTQSACSSSSFDFAITHYYPGSYFGGAKPGELLSLPQFDLPQDVVTGVSGGSTPYKSIQQLLTQYCSNAANIKLLMTETSPNNSLAPNFPAPVMGLFVMHEMLTSMSLGYQNFDWLELHSSTTQTNYMDNTFLDSSENPGPSYYGIQMSHLLAAPGDSLVSASATPQSTASTGIISYATLKTDGRKGIVLINADPTNALTAQVTITGAQVGTSATEYSYGVNATGSGSQLAGTAFTIPGQSFPVTVPAYTAVELLIP